MTREDSPMVTSNRSQKPLQKTRGANFPQVLPEASSKIPKLVLCTNHCSQAARRPRNRSRPTGLHSILNTSEFYLVFYVIFRTLLKQKEKHWHRTSSEVYADQKHLCARSLVKGNKIQNKTVSQVKECMWHSELYHYTVHSFSIIAVIMLYLC